MTKERIYGKLADRLGERIAEQNLTPRSDMEIIDVQEISPLAANVLIGYESHVGGAPTLSQLERFIEATFAGRVHAQTATAAVHEVDSALSVCCTLHTDTRPLTDTIGMRRLASGFWHDDATQHLWMVADSGTQKFLMRRTDENVAEILASRISRSKGRKTASFARIRQAAPILTNGDRVRFYDGALPIVGQISSMRDEDVTISANGKSYTVPRESVFNVVERSQTKVTDNKGLLNDYYSRAFGSDAFADKLTNKSNSDEGNMGKDTGWSGTTGTSE